MFPAARLKEELRLTPSRLGAIIGHQCAVGVWCMEWIENELKNPQTVEGTELTEEQLKQAEVFYYKLIVEWYGALRRLAKRALASCVDQQYDTMRDFLLAYATAFSRKPSGGGVGGMGSSALGIYNFMLLYWRIVARLDSVHHLHAVLVKVFGPYRAGDLKRIEKICQRIGLHYRKAGRPKKLNNSDNQTA